MNLLQAFHATKVLVLACALAMPAGLPAAADDGLAGVQTQVRHIRSKHRPPGHAFRKNDNHHRFFAGDRRHRSVTTAIDGFSSTGSRDLFSVRTKTRHVRLQDRRHHFARRDRKGFPRVIVIGGGYAPIYGSYDADLPSVIPGIGTYAGDLSAYEEVGNGIYFRRTLDYRYVAENDFYDFYDSPPMKRAKIIFVTPKTNASACSFEAGVCVIRP